MLAERATPNLTLRVGVAATVAALAQILVLAVLEGGRPARMLPAFVLLPPSLVPTLCVVWTLARSRVLFPGTHGVPIALALGSWHVAFLLCALVAPILDINVEGSSTPLLMSVCGTIPIAVAVWRLVRRWDWGCVFWMVGAGAAVGGFATVSIDWAVLMLATTVLWTTAVGFAAGFWLTRAMANQD